MKRRLFIHIGAHRTATTSIQTFLRENFEALQRAGYFNLYGAGRSVELFNRIFAGDLDVKELSAEIQKRADSKKSPIHSIVLSDEDVSMRRDLSVLQKFADDFDVKILFSMRRQDLWLESWHQQNVKWQWNSALAHLTFPQFLERREEFHWIHYDRITAHLADLFGSENLILRVFERGEMPDGPVVAFCTDLGLADLTTFSEPPHVNSSLAPISSEFMRAMPLDEIPPKYRTLIETAVIAMDQQLAQRRGKSSGFLMDSATRAAVLSAYEVGNATVARQYFGREQLFREPLPAPDAIVADQTLPTDSYELMRDFVAPMLRKLAHQYELADAGLSDPEARAQR